MVGGEALFVRQTPAPALLVCGQRGKALLHLSQRLLGALPHPMCPGLGEALWAHVYR